MTYLDLARSALSRGEKREQRPSQTTAGRCEDGLDGEKSEICEKSPATNDAAAGLTAEEVARLKGRIIAVVTADPAHFDRELYGALMTEWTAYEASLATNGDASGEA
jgi:hypothetical protein